ncbi:MAG TPA: hypothetical protein VF525_15010 [Pyrinomonadaceae bacterium]|jgi:hypothetical protein
MPDDPIVVSGGSVTIDFSDNFQPATDAKKGGKTHRHAHDDVRLISILVNDKQVVALNPKDTVTIICRY